jgi:hypothetical protein
MVLYYTYILLYIQPEYCFEVPKHVAVNYLKLNLIKLCWILFIVTLSLRLKHEDALPKNVSL